MCDSKELLVSFLYDELADADRVAFEQHLGVCADCRGEVAALRVTQQQLARWSPPVPDLGFQVIRTPVAVPVATAPRTWRGAWALAAAAVLVLAAGAALAHIEVRYGTDGLVIRTGWGGKPADVRLAAVAAVPAASVASDWAAQTRALELRVHQLEASLGAQGKAVPAQTDAEDRAVLRRVNAMVAESEARQQRTVATRLARLTAEIDARRKMDLALIDQGLMRVQSQSGAELRQSRDLMQRMYRATAYQPK